MIIHEFYCKKCDALTRDVRVSSLNNFYAIHKTKDCFGVCEWIATYEDRAVEACPVCKRVSWGEITDEDGITDAFQCVNCGYKPVKNA